MLSYCEKHVNVVEAKWHSEFYKPPWTRFCFNSWRRNLRRPATSTRDSYHRTNVSYCRKCLRRFTANLFRKRCTKFSQNRPSFVEDITKNILASFFWTHCI